MSGVPNPTPQESVWRLPLLAAGWLFVGLGIVGAFLPVMPTTIFMIAALACFAKASPRLARWLLDHPRFGPPLRAWTEEGAISKKSKRLAVAAMAVSWGIVAATAHNILVPVGVGAVLVIVAIYVATRPLPAARE
ncbi:MAG: YbaN family protein [Rhodospirillaceae bacterium]|nr:YbaN family protein [Rhodospirillaceae bacterium]